MMFENFAVQPPSGQTPRFKCANVVSEEGLPGKYESKSVVSPDFIFFQDLVRQQGSERIITGTYIQ